MSTYGYVRVSTHEQSYDYQKNQILHFSNEKRLGNVIFVENVVSGAKNWKQRAIGTLVEQMQSNDVLIVNEGALKIPCQSDRITISRRRIDNGRKDRNRF